MSIGAAYPPPSQLAPLGPLDFTYVDVGGRDGVGPPWLSIQDLIAVVGFEPDPEECERLNRRSRPRHRALCAALSDHVGTADLHLARSRGASSLLKPNFAVLDHFPETARFATERTIQVECTTLDTLAQAGDLTQLDFLKLDVQGAELKVLEGGAGILPGELIGLESEVEFLPLYQGQPLFADIDAWVRQRLGFELMDIRTSYWRRIATPTLGATKGQLVFGDALYFRSPEAVLAMARPQKVEAALVMAVAYGYFDYAVRVLTLAEQQAAVPAARVQVWRAALTVIGANRRPFAGGSPRLAELFHALYRLFQGNTGGWSTIGTALGSRKRFWWFE